MCREKSRRNNTLTFKDIYYKKSEEEVILGMALDHELTFVGNVKKKKIVKNQIKNQVHSEKYQSL